MPKLVPKRLPTAKTGDIIDVAQMALVGAFVDALSAPYLGGGTIKSAGLKLASGYVVGKYVGGGDIGRILSGGLIFAGVLDGINTLGLSDMASGLGGRLGGAGQPQVEDW